jgi:hypothetical protein
MTESFPLHFTLESGTHVTVSKTGNNTFHFNLKPGAEPGTEFTYIDDGRSKAEWDDMLDYEQLQALRKFWLENEDVV